jgi:hypothetical protein
VIMGIRAIHRAISSIHSLSRSLALKQQGQSVSSSAFHEYIHSISLNLSFKTSALLSYLPVLQRKTQQNANYSLSYTFDTALSIRQIPRPQTRHVCVLINSPPSNRAVCYENKTQRQLVICRSAQLLSTWVLSRCLAPPPDVPNHMRNVSRRIHGIHYSSNNPRRLGIFVLVLVEGHEHA